MPPSISHAESTSSLNSTGSRPSAYRDGFEYPAAQRRKARRQITITGTRDAGSRIKGALEPSRYIFVHRLQNGTSEDNTSTICCFKEATKEAWLKEIGRNMHCGQLAARADLGGGGNRGSVPPPLFQSGPPLFF